MKTIRASHQRFAKLNSPLGIRQPAGSMNKRQVESVNLKAIKLRSEAIQTGGIVGKRYRVGFESVIDAGVEKARLYCERCGTMQKCESEKDCRICKLSLESVRGSRSELFFNKATNTVECRFVPASFKPLSSDKFALVCQTCEMPFYLKDKPKADVKTTFTKLKLKANKLKSDGQIYSVGFGTKPNESASDALENRAFDLENGFITCVCFSEQRKKYSADLRRDRKARKLFLVEQNKSSISFPQQAQILADKSDANRELKQILTSDKSGLSRIEKQVLSRRKVELLRLIAS